MIYVLIKNSIVLNTIVAEQDFIESITQDYDTILSFKEDESYPSPGDSYDGKIFTKPEPPISPPDVFQQLDVIHKELAVLDPNYKIPTDTAALGEADAGI